MPINSRIHLGPDFEDFTMTSENFRWLHSCRWEASHFEAFVRLRKQNPLNLAKAPNLVKSKTSHNPTTNARWALADENDETVAWAELQEFPSKHDRFGFLYWGVNRNDEAFAEQHLTRLVSFCFLIGKFDHIKVVGLDSQSQILVDALGRHVGEIRKTFTFRNHAWYPNSLEPLVCLETLEIARDEWVRSPISNSDDKTLQMIGARIKRFERAQVLMTPKRKKRSILARLLRPKVDDAFF